MASSRSAGCSTRTASGSAVHRPGQSQPVVADVDNDGRQEIIYGAVTIDDNGTPMYASGLGHGDALHVGDFIPSRAGLEIWDIHESSNQLGRGPARRAHRRADLRHA